MSENIENIKAEALFNNSPFTVDKLEGRGGSFLIIPVDKGNVFSKEKFTEDHLMFQSAAIDFAINRIKPIYKDLNVMNGKLSNEIFKEVGQLGFLGVDIPEKFGGLDLDKTTACIILDGLSSGRSASLMVTISAHTGIGSLPLIWYGNENQNSKYLSKIASGEFMSCFALTEPSAGSDAMAGTTTAKLSSDKTHYFQLVTALAPIIRSEIPEAEAVTGTIRSRHSHRQDQPDSHPALHVRSCR